MRDGPLRQSPAEPANGVAAPDAAGVVRSALASGPGREVQALGVSLEKGAVVLTRRAPREADKGEAESAAGQALRRAGRPARVESRINALDVVREAVRKGLNDEVTAREPRLEGGRLTLEGEITKFGHLQPARVIARRALQEAGFGPIKDWVNNLKRTKRWK